MEQRPISKESNNGENVRIVWNKTAIACTTENQEFSEIMLDDLAEINKKIQRKDGGRSE